jgi:LPS export ABC transporter protein LptC
MKQPLLILTCLLVIACKEIVITEPLIYDGPMREANNVEMLYAEDNLVKTKMLADVVLEFQDGNREFPKGIYIEFYNEEGQLSSILKANQAHFSKTENLWRGWDNVEVKNILNNEQLNTEELFWKPDTEKIYTDKFVTIRLDKEVLYGKGLEAKQDFTSYTIKEPQGEFIIED